MMIGISGSGKSSISHYFADRFGFELVSSDDKRQEWYGDAEDQSHNKELFDRLDALVCELLSEGKNVIFDATNISEKSRKRFLAIAKKCKTSVSAFVVHTPIEIAKARNAERDRKVPEFVIDRQYQNFQMPTQEEGFDTVLVFDNSKSIL